MHAKSPAATDYRRVSDPDALATALLAGERRALARAITLAESTRDDHRRIAEAVIDKVLPRTGKAIRLGITGTPGVGKSTFIEAFGRYLTAAGKRVAVLAVDPSSALSGGSILGDKTRMEELARDPAAFIRPSPAGRTLGGVARRTREAMLLAEAAGFDVVIIETVGVGQSETAVAEMVDLFLLLLAPGGGDELQGIKRGIMEIADLVVVNKADGDLLPAARLAATEYGSALRLMRAKLAFWRPRVLLASALNRDGLDAVWRSVEDFRKAAEAEGELGRRRAQQANTWLWGEIREGLTAAFRAYPAVARALPEIERRVAAGQLNPAAAARELLKRFQK
ncbi:methylmalonyl Co-A mutase-associated GTPase MeaB [Desertibaculum subflavum]|uniref:methylmalonyl Co-A mutase-associated GTPase MeaB n=1 Tax=Desertibaculum subflavum TaxID=2268458 RepID=UPI000E66467E